MTENLWDYLQTEIESFNILPDNRHAAQTSEQRLYAAILIQAMLDATRLLTPEMRQETVSATREARVWFEAYSSTATDWLETVCSSAGYSSHTIRTFYKWLREEDKSLNRRKISNLAREFEEEDNGKQESR